MIPFLKEAVTGLFSKPSTEGYPFTPKEAPVGYRGRIVFHADRCISCGSQYEGRNHSTVLTSIRKVEDLIKTDPEISATVRDISSNINSRS